MKAKQTIRALEQVWSLAQDWPMVMKLYGGWEGSCKHSDYGLPADDPFFTRHDPLSEFKNAVDVPKFKVGDWVVKTGNFAENCGTVPVTVKGIVGIFDENDTIYLSDGTSCGALCIRLATRSDFIVKRNGHEWLAEYTENGDIKLYHNFTGDKAYGNATFNTLTCWNEYGESICEELNLPVCPAGL